MQFLTTNKPLMDKMHEEIKEILNSNSALIARFGYNNMLSFACDKVMKKHIKVIKGDD